jgi:hypothetical protein
MVGISQPWRENWPIINSRHSRFCKKWNRETLLICLFTYFLPFRHWCRAKVHPIPPHPAISLFESSHAAGSSIFCFLFLRPYHHVSPHLSISHPADTQLFLSSPCWLLHHAISLLGPHLGLLSLLAPHLCYSSLPHASSRPCLILDLLALKFSVSSAFLLLTLLNPHPSFCNLTLLAVHRVLRQNVASHNVYVT